MGADALQDNGITKKLLYFIQDRRFTSPNDPLRRVRKSRTLLFVSIQLVAFGATFAVTQTIGISFLNVWMGSLLMLPIAAIGFPVIIMFLIPLRVLVIPRLPFKSEELAILDKSTASPFVSHFYNVLHQLMHSLFLSRP